MKLAELFRAIGAVAQADGTAAQCEALARDAENLADMVGWAPGPIDPGGQWLARLATLQADLQDRYARTNETALVALNDRLTRLGQAIARHDEDLEAEPGDYDEGDDFQ
jgi:hypothetical protein